MRYVLIVFWMLLSSVTSAMAQVGVSGAAGIDSSGRYEQERAWCMANTQGDGRVACLKDSGAAQAEKRGGTLDNSGANFDANAMQRCEALAGEDRATCKLRVMGYGSASGSVQGGGIIRQVETVVLPAGQSPVIVERAAQ